MRAAPPSSLRNFLALVALAAVAALSVFLYRGRTSPASGDAGPARAALSGEGNAASRSHGSPLAWQPVHLLGGQTEPVGTSDLGRFEGHVRSLETGRTVPQANLTFVGPRGALSGQTDAQGHFVLAPPAEG